MIITVMMRVILFTGSADSGTEHQAPVARNGKKTERIRLHDFPRWFAAVAAVRDQGEQERDDIAVTVCDAVEMALLPD